MILGVLDTETVAQLTLNGIFRGAAYGILGVGFALILGVTGRFHFAYAFTYTLAAYMVVHVQGPRRACRSGSPSSPASWSCAIFGCGDRAIHLPAARRAEPATPRSSRSSSPRSASRIAGENVIRLLLGQREPEPDRAQAGRVQPVERQLPQLRRLAGRVERHRASWCSPLLLRYTSLGRSIKATRVEPRARPDDRHRRERRSTCSCFFIGTLLRGVAAFWYGLQFTIDPAMGFKPVIFAFVVAFLAGTASSPIRVFLTGIAVALIEQYASIWLSVRWTQTAVFVVLVVYLSWLVSARAPTRWRGCGPSWPGSRRRSCRSG